MDGTKEYGLGDWDGDTSKSEAKLSEKAARELSRVGVVDIGSNSVRLVVFDGAARSPAYFFNEKIMCGLGAGMHETGLLNPEGRSRAKAALARFRMLADGMGLPNLNIVATAAMREAKDGPEFRKEIEKELGITVDVIDGQEEARLSAQGVMLGWPGAYGLICDIGGSSMELAEIGDGKVGRRETSPLGPLKLADLGGRKAREKHIRKWISTLHGQFGEQRDRMFLVGGSWRAIARIDMHRRDYPLHVLHEYRMSAEAISETIKLIETSDPQELRSACGISNSRMSLLPLASEVLEQLIDTFQPHDLAISSYGIREGLLYQQMPEKLRRRDPLIEASRFAETKEARIPGHGNVLYRFVAGLFPDADEHLSRLLKAACLLHDVSWRAHPDFRAEVCFDYVTRANLGGLTHQERVFLGVALLHRYRNKRGARFSDLYSLLSDQEIHNAEVLGKAMRLGAMLWMSDSPQDVAELVWIKAKDHLVLNLSEEARDLFGEVVEARLQSLAKAVGASAQVQIGSEADL